ncbi:MAG: tRNA (adenosine(37)-N6)-threonylcarbamoyltransferase complex dimerization subunit type 1 TsaB [Dehalococcoidia bacterium]|nr:tRNA (adenosine(37)-N6)-threonylcarbamoyltransferase complex dimerization subunit type 1 TsaB [Dehalococcoidia bacterium]
MADRRSDLSIDAAADDTAVALATAGAITRQMAWDAHQRQSQTLLPNIDRLLTEAGLAKHDVAAVFVDIGPGGYAGLRVGVSIAKALAHGLAVPIVGLGRLELDAQLVADVAGERRIVALHRAGRGDIAWAAYEREGDALRETSPPRFDTPHDLRAALAAGDVVTGDVDTEVAAIVGAVGAEAVAAKEHRVVALAALARRRLDAGAEDDPATLVPLYLRGPAIGPRPAG